MTIKLITQNKRARFDFQLLEKVEAGLVLKGPEVKSLRESQVQLSDTYVRYDDNYEFWIYNFHIPIYKYTTAYKLSETRKRKLLLRKDQIIKIDKRIKVEKLSLIPTRLYFKKSYAKLEFCLAKPKKLYDKRRDEAKKDAAKKIKEYKM